MLSDAMSGNYTIVCGNCKHEHYRHIKNGVVTEDRHNDSSDHGDTIHVVSRVKEMRESKSRPNAGLVVFEHTGLNQRDKEVAYCTRTAFMMKQP